MWPNKLISLALDRRDKFFLFMLVNNLTQTIHSRVAKIFVAVETPLIVSRNLRSLDKDAVISSPPALALFSIGIFC